MGRSFSVKICLQHTAYLFFLYAIQTVFSMDQYVVFAQGHNDLVPCSPFLSAKSFIVGKKHDFYWHHITFVDLFFHTFSISYNDKIELYEKKPQINICF